MPTINDNYHIIVPIPLKSAPAFCDTNFLYYHTNSNSVETAFYVTFLHSLIAVFTFLFQITFWDIILAC